MVLPPTSAVYLFTSGFILVPFLSPGQGLKKNKKNICFPILFLVSADDLILIFFQCLTMVNTDK